MLDTLSFKSRRRRKLFGFVPFCSLPPLFSERWYESAPSSPSEDVSYLPKHHQSCDHAIGKLIFESWRVKRFKTELVASRPFSVELQQRGREMPLRHSELRSVGRQSRRYTSVEDLWVLLLRKGAAAVGLEME